MKYYYNSPKEIEHLQHSNQGFKYDFKKFINGKWRYFYDDVLGAGSKKQLEEAKSKKASLDDRVNSTWNQYKLRDDEANRRLEKYKKTKFDENLYNQGTDKYNKQLENDWKSYKEADYLRGNAHTQFFKASKEKDKNDATIKKEQSDYEKSLMGRTSKAISKGKEVISNIFKKLKNKRR